MSYFLSLYLVIPRYICNNYSTTIFSYSIPNSLSTNNTKQCNLFDSVHPKPSPLLADNSDKHKKFEDIYGTVTTEKDRPSLKASGNKALDEPIKHILNASEVHDVITCGECLRIDAVKSSERN